MPEWLVQITSHVTHMLTAGNAQDIMAIFIIASLTEFGIPFPLILDSLLFLVGFSIGDFWLKALFLILILVIGREAGSAVIFVVARSVRGPVLKFVGSHFPSLPGKVARISKKLGLKAPVAVAVGRLSPQSAVAITATGLGIRAPLTIALARMTPGLLTATSVASGMLGMRYRYFFIGTGISSMLGDLTEISIGAFIGLSFRQFVGEPSWGLILAGGVLNLLIVFLVQRLLWRRSKTINIKGCGETREKTCAPAPVVVSGEPDVFGNKNI